MPVFDTFLEIHVHVIILRLPLDSLFFATGNGSKLLGFAPFVVARSN